MLYIQLGLLSYGVFYNDMTALTVQASIMLFLASIFYIMSFNLIAGLSASRINYKLPVGNALASRMIQITTAIAIFKIGDYATSIMIALTLPWVFVNLATDILAFLVKKEIVMIVPSDD